MDNLADLLDSVNISDLLCAVEVVVPDGIGPGDTLRVTTSWGGEYNVVCPAAMAGSCISVNLPAAPDTDQVLLSRISDFIDDDESGFMKPIEDFCLAQCHRVTDSARSSTEVKEFSLQTQEVHAEYVSLVERLLEEHLAQRPR